jgi:HEAT repeat protein
MALQRTGCWLDDHRSVVRRYVATVALLFMALSFSACRSTTPFARRHDQTPRIDSVPTALGVIRESRDPARRREAFEYLCKPSHMRGDESLRADVCEILGLAIKADPDPHTRVIIVRGLGEIGGAEQTPAIVAATSDSEPAVRIAVCRVLGKLKAQDATANLDSLFMTDPDLDVRLAAAEALGQLPNQQAALALVGGLHDPDVAVRFRCRESLKEMLGHDHGADLDAWRGEIRQADFEQLARPRRFGIF